MADFKKNNRFTHSARKPFDRGGPRSFGPRQGGDREMFDAECANCHKMTQVPFRPNGMKPVYCRDCFKPEGEREQGGRFEKRDFAPKRSFAPRAPQTDSGMADVKRQLDAMNATLEKIAALLEATSRKESLSAELEKYRAPKAKAATKKAAPKKAKKK